MTMKKGERCAVLLHRLPDCEDVQVFTTTDKAWRAAEKIVNERRNEYPEMPEKFKTLTDFYLTQVWGAATDDIESFAIFIAKVR